MSRRRPLERIGRAVPQLSPGASVAVGISLTLVAGVLDYLTGPQLASLTFYLVPVAIVGRAGTRWQGLACGVLAASLWAVAEAADGRTYDNALVFLWASLTRLVVLVAVASLLHRRSTTPRPDAVQATGEPCPHCGSSDTVVMRMGLVCRGCKRLS